MIFEFVDDGLVCELSCDDGRNHDLRLEIDIMDNDGQILKTINRSADDFELKTFIPMRSNYDNAVCKLYGDGKLLYHRTAFR